MRTKLPFVLALTCAFVLATGVARAEEGNIAALEAQANEMLAQVKQAAQAYEQATEEVEDLAGKVANNEAAMADIEARLPEQRARTASSIKSMYLFQQSAPGLLELVLSSSSFNDFFTTVRYIDSIHAHNVTEVNALTELEDELAQTQAQLSSEREAATRKQAEALAALQEVSAAREGLSQRIDALRHEAQAAGSNAEQQQAKALVEQVLVAESEAVEALPTHVAKLTEPSDATAVDTKAEASAAQVSSDSSANDTTAPTTEEGIAERNDATAAAPALTGASDAGSSSIDSWATRIDAYLADSPLAGYGATFAQAAEECGIDPRIAPAIACVESGKGAVCFLPHNAWGWGSASWPDWPSAVRGYVAGLAGTYGSSLTIEDARLYAGADIYEYWYGLVQGEMSAI